MHTLVWKPAHVMAWCQALRSSPTPQLLLLLCSGPERQYQVVRRVLIRGEKELMQVTPKDIFQHCRDVLAQSVVICQNRPDGSPFPSHLDDVFTARLEAACQLIGYTLLDHLIVSTTEYYSFREAGKLLPLPD